jgi:serine/threonine protein phosphatase PrpC
VAMPLRPATSMSAACSAGRHALSAILTAASIYVFNVGNSRAVLAKHYQETNSIESFQVTHDHNLERFD